MLYQTSLAEVRDRVDRLHTSTGESGEWCSVEKIQRLQEWLKSLKPFGGKSSFSNAIQYVYRIST